MPHISVHERHKPLRFLATVKCPIPTLFLKANKVFVWRLTGNFICYKTLKWQTMLLHVRKESGLQDMVIFCLDSALWLLC